MFGRVRCEGYSVNRAERCSTDAGGRWGAVRPLDLLGGIGGILTEILVSPVLCQA